MDRGQRQMITISSPLIAGKTIRQIEAEYRIHVKRVDGEPPDPGESLQVGATIDVTGLRKNLTRFRRNAVLADVIAKRIMAEYGTDAERATRFANEYICEVESDREPQRAKELVRRLREHR